jgi:hypothetical protein
VGVCSNFSTGVTPSFVIPVGHGDLGAETVVVASVEATVVVIVVGRAVVPGTGVSVAVVVTAVVVVTVVVSSCLKQAMIERTVAFGSSPGVDGTNVTFTLSDGTNLSNVISVGLSDFSTVCVLGSPTCLPSLSTGVIVTSLMLSNLPVTVWYTGVSPLGDFGVKMML